MTDTIKPQKTIICKGNTDIFLKTAAKIKKQKSDL
jgi:hypothetical protein